MIRQEREPWTLQPSPSACMLPFRCLACDPDQTPKMMRWSSRSHAELEQLPSLPTVRYVQPLGSPVSSSVGRWQVHFTAGLDQHIPTGTQLPGTPPFASPRCSPRITGLVRSCPFAGRHLPRSGWGAGIGSRAADDGHPLADVHLVLAQPMAPGGRRPASAVGNSAGGGGRRPFCSFLSVSPMRWSTGWMLRGPTGTSRKRRESRPGASGSVRDAHEGAVDSPRSGAWPPQADACTSGSPASSSATKEKAVSSQAPRGSSGTSALFGDAAQDG
jgi:hypothetical protein